MRATETRVNPSELQLLDWFAGCALIGLVRVSWSDAETTQCAFDMARAMLKARAEHVPMESEGQGEESEP